MRVISLGKSSQMKLTNFSKECMDRENIIAFSASLNSKLILKTEECNNNLKPKFNFINYLPQIF